MCYRSACAEGCRGFSRQLLAGAYLAQPSQSRNSPQLSFTLQRSESRTRSIRLPFASMYSSLRSSPFACLSYHFSVSPFTPFSFSPTNFPALLSLSPSPRDPTIFPASRPPTNLSWPVSTIMTKTAVRITYPRITDRTRHFRIVGIFAFTGMFPASDIFLFLPYRVSVKLLPDPLFLLDARRLCKGSELSDS